MMSATLAHPLQAATHATVADAFSSTTRLAAHNESHERISALFLVCFFCLFFPSAVCCVFLCSYELQSR
jgi:hypothetical protein